MRYTPSRELYIARLFQFEYKTRPRPSEDRTNGTFPNRDVRMTNQPRHNVGRPKTVPSLPYDRGFAVQQMEPELEQQQIRRGCVGSTSGRRFTGYPRKVERGRWMQRVMSFLSSVQASGALVCRVSLQQERQVSQF